jgi:hypothetical protein
VTEQVVMVGGPEAAESLRRYCDQLQPEVEKAAGPFGERLRDLVANQVPVLTGTLAGSVASDTDSDGMWVGYDGSAPYDGWIEFGGSRGRDAVPEGRYLYPITQAAEPDWIEVGERTATDLVRETRWPTPV